MKNLYYSCLSLLLVTAHVRTDTQPNNPFPLCQTCGCKYSNNSDGVKVADVSCTKDSSYNIFQDHYWITKNDKNVTQPFLYNSFTFQNQAILNLTYVFPPANLTYVNLANNDINDITDSVFKNLQNMKTLILSYNDLQIIHPDAFKGVYLETRLMPLKSLRELRLDHNKFHSLNQDLFEHCTDIEILDLSHNPLKIIDNPTLGAIDTLAKLKELYLQYTDIPTLPDNMLHPPKFLRILDLSGNPIKEIPATLAQAPNLVELYLNNTGFVNLTEENGFPKMPSVKVLHLSRNEYLCHIHKHALSGLINLEELRMSDNIALIDIDEMALTTPLNNSGGTVWPPVKRLYIENNKLAYLDSDIIARWDGLTALDIRGNPWTCECENQWLIEDLMPVYLKIDEMAAKEVVCAAPIEMIKFTFVELYERHSHMRCLDVYGAHPENDATMLVGILAGILIAIPAVLLLIVAYQRRWFSFLGICDKSPASYSRRFYSASATDDNF